MRSRGGFTLGVGLAVTARCVLMASSAEAAVMLPQEPTTRIVHSPIETFVPGFRISVRARIEDSSDITAARCYFRARGEANFLFVDLDAAGPGNRFAAVLPAPSVTTEAIEYVLLSVAGSSVVRTQTFTMLRSDVARPGDAQMADTGGQISVKTELAQAPRIVPGFTDSIAVDAVESAVRFGYVVQFLYTDSQMAGRPPSGYSGTTVSATSVAEASGVGTAGVRTVGGAGQVAGTTGRAISTAAGGGSKLPWLLVGAGAAAGGVVLAKKQADGTSAAALPCNSTTNSGGFGVTTNVHNLGKSSGSFTFSWNTLSIPDAIVVTYEGRTLLSTGRVSGTGSRVLSFSGKSKSITVTVTGDSTGTSWSYVVGCP